MFELSEIPLEKLDLRQGLISMNAGAFCSFEGWVRDRNDGKEVLALEYEAYEPLCRKEAQRIFDEARQRFPVIALRCIHRIGRLGIGEMAVWVGVLAGHRDASFKACRYIIDELKKRLPIWKKEYYVNGESQWVTCRDFHQSAPPQPAGDPNAK